MAATDDEVVKVGIALDEKIPCQVCGKKMPLIATHEPCLMDAVNLSTLDDLSADYSPETVKRIDKDCYLAADIAALAA